MKTDEEKTDETEVSKWPFLWGSLLYLASVDYVIIPFVLEPLKVPFWSAFWIGNLVANLEIIGGFLFWRWCIWVWLPTTKPVKDTVELTENVLALLAERGLLKTIKYKVLQTFKWATNPKSKLINLAKNWGHLGMFVLGAESIVSGGRLIGTIICASTKWKAGLYSLIAGNMIHVAISIGTWKLLFYLWGEYRIPMIVCGVIGTIFLAIFYVWRKSKRGQAK